MTATLVGRTLAAWRVTETLAGGVGRGIHRAQGTDGAGRYLLSSIPAADDDERWVASMTLPGPGVTPLVFAGRVVSDDQQRWVVVEREPPGNPLFDKPTGPVDPAATAALLAAVARMAQASAQVGQRWGLHPRLVYVDAGTVAVAPRGSMLLDLARGEWSIPIMAPTLEAPERLTGRGNPRTEASTVFSLCALGSWLATTRPPFGTTLQDELRAHFHQPEGDLAWPTPLRFLGLGLRRDPHARPRLAALIESLERLAPPMASAPVLLPHVAAPPAPPAPPAPLAGESPPPSTAADPAPYLPEDDQRLRAAAVAWARGLVDGERATLGDAREVRCLWLVRRRRIITERPAGGPGSFATSFEPERFEREREELYGLGVIEIVARARWLALFHVTEAGRPGWLARRFGARADEPRFSLEDGWPLTEDCSLGRCLAARRSAGAG